MTILEQVENQPEKKYPRITISVSSELSKRIKEEALKRNMSVSSLMSKLFELALNRS